MNKSKPRSRGRPATTSRDEILDHAVAWLESDNDAEISLSGLARRMGYTPMALYSYFRDKDDLWQALAERLLSDMECDLGGARSWQARVRAWAESLRRHFLKRPYAIRYTGWRGHVSGGWLRQVAVLVKVLADAGFSGEKLVRAAKWYSTSVNAMVHSELVQRQTSVRLDASDLAAQDESSAELLAPLIPMFTRISHQQVFRDHLDAAVAWLERELVQ